MSDSDADQEEIDNTPQIIRETHTTWHSHKNPRLEHYKNIIQKNQGKNQIPLKDLEFYQEQIPSQIPQGFCQSSKMEKKFRETTMKFLITLLITTEMIMSTWKSSSLTTLNIFHWHITIFTSTEKIFSIAIKFFSPC